MFYAESSGSCSHRIQPLWWCLYANGNRWSLTQMSPELSTSCQVHTESLTIIHCSLRHHTEHPKWLKLVGIVQHWGRLLVMSHRALTSWLKGKLCHTDGSQTVPTVTGHHTEHPRLISLKEQITPSLNSFSFDLASQYQNQSQIKSSRSCRCSCFYIAQLWSCSYSFCRLLQTHPLTTQH